MVVNTVQSEQSLNPVHTFCILSRFYKPSGNTAFCIACLAVPVHLPYRQKLMLKVKQRCIGDHIDIRFVRSLQHCPAYASLFHHDRIPIQVSQAAPVYYTFQSVEQICHKVFLSLRCTSISSFLAVTSVIR